MDPWVVLNALGGFDAAWDLAEEAVSRWHNQLWPQPTRRDLFEALERLVASEDSVRDDSLAPDLAELLATIGKQHRPRPEDSVSVFTNRLHDQLAAAGLVTS